MPSTSIALLSLLNPVAGMDCFGTSYGLASSAGQPMGLPVAPSIVALVLGP